MLNGLQILCCMLLHNSKTSFFVSTSGMHFSKDLCPSNGKVMKYQTSLAHIQYTEWVIVQNISHGMIGTLFSSFLSVYNLLLPYHLFFTVYYSVGLKIYLFLDLTNFILLFYLLLLKISLIYQFVPFCV